MPTVVIDPGHGGGNPGAVSGPLHEADINLDIALAMEKELANVPSIETRLTHRGEGASLVARTDFANSIQADVFYSIHVNANEDPNASGYSDYIYKEPTSGSIALQDTVNPYMAEYYSQYGFINHGELRANFHVLRESNMPSILTENLFISNPTDRAFLSSVANRKKIGQVHAYALMSYYGLEVPSPTAQPSISAQALIGLLLLGSGVVATYLLRRGV